MYIVFKKTINNSQIDIKKRVKGIMVLQKKLIRLL